MESNVMIPKLRAHIWDIPCSDFDCDSSVDLNFTEKVNEVTMSYIGIISLDFYTLEFCIYAFMTVGREDNTEDSGSITGFIFFCFFFF